MVQSLVHRRFITGFIYSLHSIADSIVESPWSLFTVHLHTSIPTSSTSTGSIDHILSATSLAHTVFTPECLSGGIIHPHTAPYHYTNTWQMEDHLCPRIVQPQAACLLCLSRLSQEPAKLPSTKCTTNRVRFTVSPAKAPKPSHRSHSQAPTPTTRTRTRSRVDHAVQPAAPRPTPAFTMTTPPHNSLQNHMHHHDLAKFSTNITTTAIPAEALAAEAPAPHQCESSPLYARLMKRYSASALLNPWAKPINSRRSLPTPR